MQLKGKFLLIRADANGRMGTGHLMRCLALTQGWKDRGGQATFITACESDSLRRRLSDEDFQVVTLERSHPDSADWEVTSQVLAAHSDAWVVLDGYHFDPAYQRQIKEAGHPLLVIDDTTHLDHYYADVVLNQNINAERLRYSCEPYTRLLLGTRYALLRSEFLAWRGWQREIPEVARKVLVTLGGSDPDNQTSKVIQALQRIDTDELEVVVVVGASNPHFLELRSTAHDSLFAIRLVENVTDMPRLMAWADVAVSAGGSTCWEMAFMGLPSLILVLAENQRGIAEGLDAYGIALNLGSYAQVSELDLAQALKILMCDLARREAMSEKGRQLVDGAGTDRVVSVMYKLAQTVTGADRLRVRRARFQDAEILWQWANDSSVRANSFHPQPIPLDEHIKWYKAKLASPDTRIWILELNQVPVAQIRYDRVHADAAEISFSVVSDYRGRGLGTEALILTSDMACRELGVKRLKGIVFSSNAASMRAFIKAGFECVSQEQVFDKLCHIFVRECSQSLKRCND
jgi:UDP-2,4-diacetamido-2,4,6-trideoxy-beta-L-altropyranose hydrolase